MLYISARLFEYSISIPIFVIIHVFHVFHLSHLLLGCLLVFAGIYHGPQPLGGCSFRYPWRLGNFISLQFLTRKLRVVYTVLLQLSPSQ